MFSGENFSKERSLLLFWRKLPDSYASCNGENFIVLKRVAFRLLESFSINDESNEHEIWKKVPKSMRKVLNLVRRTRRTTILKWKVVVGKRIGLPTEKARKVDLVYFAGFKCALEGCYKHRLWAGIIGTVITASRTAARSLSPWSKQTKEGNI